MVAVADLPTDPAGAFARSEDGLSNSTAAVVFSSMVEQYGSPVAETAKVDALVVPLVAETEVVDAPEGPLVVVDDDGE